ncbi:hypothetical protein Tco_1548215 [Tanacetum coccineum]
MIKHGIPLQNVHYLPFGCLPGSSFKLVHLFETLLSCLFDASCCFCHLLFLAHGLSTCFNVFSMLAIFSSLTSLLLNFQLPKRFIDFLLIYGHLDLVLLFILAYPILDLFDFACRLLLVILSCRLLACRLTIQVSWLVLAGSDQVPLGTQRYHLFARSGLSVVSTNPTSKEPMRINRSSEARGCVCGGL